MDKTYFTVVIITVQLIGIFGGVLYLLSMPSEQHKCGGGIMETLNNTRVNGTVLSVIHTQVNGTHANDTQVNGTQLNTQKEINTKIS